jgi:Zn-dependent protease
MPMNQDVSPVPKKTGLSSFFAKNRTWLNVVLFILTLISCYFVGMSWALSYRYADVLDTLDQASINLQMITDPRIIGLSLAYTLVLMTILLAHEMGHYLTCRHYGLDATLPFFIPAPTLIGTMGAFIKIKSPIRSKQQLFDIGMAGPLAGFVLALPALIYGLSLSKVVANIPEEGSIIFGEPLLLKILGVVFFSNLAEGADIVLHPIAFTGWVGILVTALNLFPIGQLDGGHILYSLLGPRTRKLAPVFLISFLVMGVFFWIGWFLWAVLIYFMGLRHPRIWDDHNRLSRGRQILGIVLLIIFVLSFIPDPVKGYSLLNFL